MRIKNMNDLQKFLQPKIKKALENVSKELTDGLKKYICTDLYEQKKDIVSANILSILENVNYNVKSSSSNISATIFIESNLTKNFKEEISNTVLDNYLDYCNKNYARLFKQEMIKLGVPLR